MRLTAVIALFSCVACMLCAEEPAQQPDAEARAAVLKLKSPSNNKINSTTGTTKVFAPAPAGQALTADGTGFKTIWAFIKGTDIDSSIAGSPTTNGFVLTADGAGKANWNPITNAQLGSNLTLGGTTTGTFVGDGSGLTNLSISNSLADSSVTNVKLVNPSLTVSAGTGLTGGGLVSLGDTTTLSLGSNLTLVGTTTGTFNGPLTGNVTGNASGSAASFTGNLAGNVTGPQGATVVASVGGVTSANVAAGANLANAATNLNTASTIVKRDASGNFTAGTITASLSGNASTASSATTVTGALAGNVTGTQGATVVATVGSVTAANVAAGANLANAATNLNTASTIVKRDGSGNFSVSTITATFSGDGSNLTGLNGAGLAASSVTNAKLANSSVTINTGTGLSGGGTVALGGTLTLTNTGPTTAGTGLSLTAGTLNNTGVLSLTGGGGVTVNSAAGAITLGSNATSANTPSSIVSRDASGNFTAGTITASLNGNATSTTSFSGTLAGNVTGTQGATVVSIVGGVTAANVATGANLANSATNANTASTLVKRDASGNFFAGTITANLTGNASGSAGSFTGSLLGDVTGTQGATVVGTVGTSTAANVHTAELAANAATNVNTASTIVKRSATGAFNAGTITATAFVGDGSGLTNLPSSSGLVLKDGNGVTLGKVIAAYSTGATVLTSTGYLIDITFDGIMFPAQIYYAGTNGSGNAILNDGMGGTLTTPPRFIGKYIVYSGSRASLQEPSALTNGIEVSIAMSTQSIDNPTNSNFTATTNSGQLLQNITNAAAGLPDFISAGQFQTPITIQ